MVKLGDDAERAREKKLLDQILAESESENSDARRSANRESELADRFKLENEVIEAVETKLRGFPYLPQILNSLRVIQESAFIRGFETQVGPQAQMMAKDVAREFAGQIVNGVIRGAIDKINKSQRS